VQESGSIFGKIILIDKSGENFEIFSKGHRNPQGLVYGSGTLIATEHGPDGGDEINIIKKDGNYGWPLASYGKHYKGQKHVNKYYPLPKNHEGFEEPIKYFDKSIAISQIINVPKKFDNEDNSFFLASMKINKEFGEKINLYNFILNNEALNLKNYIPIGERIRDLIYIESKDKILMFLDTSASIAILSKIN